MRVVVIGSEGFVGSAFVRRLRAVGAEVAEVTRGNYARHTGVVADVVVDAAGNSKKFFADERPFDEFDASVGHRLRTLRDFPAGLHLHISSVDVYPDVSSPAVTREKAVFDATAASKYGFHKKMAEDLVRVHAARWLIVRLGGMVGPGMKKSPVFDLLNRQPQRVHPDSRFQYLSTDDAARLAMQLVEAGAKNEIFNICASGTLSPREISAMADVPLMLDELPSDAKPRIVEVSNEKLARVAPVPVTRATMVSFLEQWRAGLAAKKI
jgi:nucleoside-diphosphate-sugar epimerase